MKLPTIHRNGTSRADLFGDNREAAQALRVAIAKLQAAAPNGRDYYPQGPAAINQALEEHQGRLQALETVLRELDSIAGYLASPDK